MLCGTFSLFFCLSVLLYVSYLSIFYFTPMDYYCFYIEQNFDFYPKILWLIRIQQTGRVLKFFSLPITLLLRTVSPCFYIDRETDSDPYILRLIRIRHTGRDFIFANFFASKDGFSLFLHWTGNRFWSLYSEIDPVSADWPGFSIFFLCQFLCF